MTAILLLIGYGQVPLNSSPDQKQKVNAPISGVVVYPGRALVTRKATLKIGAGTQRLVLRDLANLLENHSVRAELSGKDARIMDVEISSYAVREADDPALKSLKERREKLQIDIDALSDRSSVLAFRSDYLKKAQESYLNGTDKNGKPVQRTPKEYDSMLSYLSKRIAENAADRRQLSREQTALSKKAKYLDRLIRDARNRSSKASRRKQVTVLLESSSNTTVRLGISYIVPQSGWSPGYDVRVLGNKNRIEFNGYGLVAQRSGEDWNEADIRLSTARPTTTSQPPTVEPLFVAGARGMRTDGSFQNKGNVSFTKRGTGSLVFAVPRKIPVASDGRPHRTPFTRHSLPVKFEYITFPRYGNTAYLLALGKNTMPQPILDGQINIFQENDFVGSSRSGSVLPGEDFELALGVNENIRVERKLEELVEEKAGLLGGQRMFRYSYAITVGNFSGKPATLNVIDQIPVARGTDARIEKVTHSVDPEYVNKQGIMKWKLALKSGQSQTIRFGFAITVPENSGPRFFDKEHEKGETLRKLDDMQKERSHPAQRGPALRKQMY